MGEWARGRGPSTPGARLWRTHTTAMIPGTTAYTTNHPHVTIAVMIPGSPKWNFSRLFKVANNVMTVNTNTAGTATLARSQVRRRDPSNSSRKLAQYAEPRNAAVRGGWIVHAK